MQVLTAKETCSFLRISRTTLWRLRKKGEIKGFNVGAQVFFTDDEIKLYIERQMQKGESA
ncbi:MAG: helix-turn-helix domain-containing protein [Neglectibacter timonensis]